MTAALLLVLGFTVGWVACWVVTEAHDAFVRRRAACYPDPRQAVSDIRARTRRAEEQMRRVANRGRM
ncbi:hypothetical protein [Streptomyces sp. NBC_00996]|uniref:hypothetical protein n=1 Tax=Streptomyces sp. NBC_00996 TaxID=2903710 RepID=UPI00386A5CC8|nr:hypothetical protein OG390_44900 [Streptomyces sp. NBC_00996]